MPIQEIRHPLIQHKLGLLRRNDISTKNFRELAQEVTMLLTYEATKDLPMCDQEVDGWAEIHRWNIVSLRRFSLRPACPAVPGSEPRML